MEKRYVIKQNTKDTHTDRINTKYFSGTGLGNISFSEEYSNATVYANKEAAMEDLRRIFHRVPFHMNIWYVCDPLRN